jgi:hypothetical protein
VLDFRVEARQTAARWLDVLDGYQFDDAFTLDVAYAEHPKLLAWPNLGQPPDILWNEDL